MTILMREIEEVEQQMTTVNAHSSELDQKLEVVVVEKAQLLVGVREILGQDFNDVVVTSVGEFYVEGI